MWICAAGLGLSSLLGSIIGLTIRKIPHKWNDIFLGFCAGMIPETHSHGYQKPATYALVAGVVTMLFIETLF